MKPYKVLYITFNDFGDVSSASGVRPYRIYNTFINMGYEVILLEGQQNRRAIRRKKVREISEWLNDNDPDYCYIELPTGPIFNRCDKALIKKIHRKKIPIGIFYRDILWKYPDWAWFDMNKVKRKILIAMHKSDLRLFKSYCDIVYFPSREGIEKFKKGTFAKTDVLPPGCDVPQKPNYELRKKIFYVGGVRSADGIDDALEAIDSLNRDGHDIGFILVTKNEELKYIKRKDLLNSEWLTVTEGSGNALEQYYDQCDLGILPKKRHFYMDMAISVKTLEYIAHNLPVLSTDCPAMARFIKDNNCGIICEDNAEAIREAILYYYEDYERFKSIRNNVFDAAMNNVWEKRIEKITNDLLDV